MSLVQVKCANCGAQIENAEKKGQFRCPHCGTLILNIIDAKINNDVEIVTPDDINNFLAENAQPFIINIEDRLEEFDIDAKVINKTISDAERGLKERRFGSYGLDKCPELLIVLRLRLLHSYRVCDEYELSMQSKRLEGDIYNKFISLCDETTKNTYKKIEDQIEKNIVAENEICKCDKLYAAGLCSDGLIYAKQMLKKYPHMSLAHMFVIICDFGVHIQEWQNNILDHDDIYYIYGEQYMRSLNMMKNCPDFLWQYDRFSIINSAPYSKDRIASNFLFVVDKLITSEKMKNLHPSVHAREIVYVRRKKEKDEEKRQAKLAKKQAKLAKKGK